MSAATQYEIDWRRERLAKPGTLGAQQILVLGVARSGWAFGAGVEATLQPFTGDMGSAEGYALPVSGRVVRMQVQVYANFISTSSTITLRRNENDTSMSIEIPAGQTGLFTATGSIDYAIGDRLDFHLTVGGEGAESLDIVSISVVLVLT